MPAWMGPGVARESASRKGTALLQYVELDARILYIDKIVHGVAAGDSGCLCWTPRFLAGSPLSVISCGAQLYNRSEAWAYQLDLEVELYCIVLCCAVLLPVVAAIQKSQSSTAIEFARPVKAL